MQHTAVIPVIVIADIKTAIPLCQALVDGGLAVLEITLRSDCALAAIEKVKQAIPDAIIGAGTILKPVDVQDALSAGAEFLVSPGTTPLLLDALQNHDSPFLPGISTASEAMVLWQRGIKTMKFFPAQAAGGTALLQALHGPLPQLNFCPTGGIHADNALDYLQLENVLCVGASWMLSPQKIAAQDWQWVQQQAAYAANILAKGSA